MSELNPPEYHIRDLTLSSDTELTGVQDFEARYYIKLVSIELHESPEGLAADYDINIELVEKAEKDLEFVEEEEKQPTIVDIDVSVRVFIPGEHSEFKHRFDLTDSWVDPEFQRHLESGLLSEVFAPISVLINNSARGVLPSVPLSDIAYHHGYLD